MMEGMVNVARKGRKTLQVGDLLTIWAEETSIFNEEGRYVRDVGNDLEVIFLGETRWHQANVWELLVLHSSGQGWVYASEFMGYYKKGFLDELMLAPFRK